MNFSENLKKIRLEKGLSQEAVADELGITRQGYANYEKGSSSPTLESIEKLSEALSVDINYLLFKEKIDSLEKSKRELEERFQKLELSTRYNFDINDEESYIEHLKLNARENEKLKKETIDEINVQLKRFNYSGIIKIEEYIRDLSSINKYTGIDERLQFYHEDDWLIEYISNELEMEKMYPVVFNKWDKIFMEHKDELTSKDMEEIAKTLNHLLNKFKKNKQNKNED